MHALPALPLVMQFEYSKLLRDHPPSPQHDVESGIPTTPPPAKTAERAATPTTDTRIRRLLLLLVTARFLWRVYLIRRQTVFISELPSTLPPTLHGYLTEYEWRWEGDYGCRQITERLYWLEAAKLCLRLATILLSPGALWLRSRLWRCVCCCHTHVIAEVNGPSHNKRLDIAKHLLLFGLASTLLYAQMEFGTKALVLQLSNRLSDDYELESELSNLTSTSDSTPPTSTLFLAGAMRQ